MKRKSSLQYRLSLSILGFSIVIFIVTMGFLFLRSQKSVRQAGEEQNRQLLHNMALRLSGMLFDVEGATANTEWRIYASLETDSIFGLTRAILELNPDIDGCSISFEPNFFEKEGRWFSVYSYNEQGHILTNREGDEQFDYFNLSWYSEPRRLMAPCWTDPFHDYNPNGIYAKEMIASYCRPLITADGRFIGVISSDITQHKLAQILSGETLFPNAYFLLFGRNGKVIAAGSGNANLKDLESDDVMVIRQPLGETGWTLAYVCPESDIFGGYYSLIYMVVAIIASGLILMYLLCISIVRRMMQPISQLALQTHDMANGNFNGRMAPSNRRDEVGQLQNSFVAMQTAIAGYVTDLQRVKEETELRNEQLVVAKNMMEEAGRRKTAFIQDLSHQIRTPLNIISGFIQVLRDAHSMMTERDFDTMTRDIKQNCHTITTIADNWMKTLAIEQTADLPLNDTVDCHALCQEAIQTVVLRHPDTVTLSVVPPGDKPLSIRSHRECLLKILSELLHNANKLTTEGSITIGCRQTQAGTVCFTITYTGPGISADNQEHIFTMFAKLDSFNEGLGMGLPLCRQLASLIGGTLQLDTTYTNGARFILEVKGQ